jgi:hypothetical protein
MRGGALKAKEKLRINNLKILHFDSTDHMLVAKTKATLGIIGQMSEADILSALQQAHIASDEYYTMAHAAAWNTTFVFPPDAIAADRMLWDQYGHDFTLMCKTKQDKLAGNRLSADRVRDIFGEDGMKIPGMILSDFTTNDTLPSWRKISCRKESTSLRYELVTLH